jgi:hypothetical protein
LYKKGHFDVVNYQGKCKLIGQFDATRISAKLRQYFSAKNPQIGFSAI